MRRCTIGLLSLFFLVTTFTFITDSNFNTMTIVTKKPDIVFSNQLLENNDIKQIACLAKNSYFEARNQGAIGMIAVDNVVMNRVSSNNFIYDTPCEIIYQQKNNNCQFSWVCSHKDTIKDKVLYAKSAIIAESVYLSVYPDITGGAEFYHTKQIHPHWKDLTEVASIGDHVFFKER